MSKVEVNGNFHLLRGKNLVPLQSERYREYRRKWEENPLKRIVERFPIHLDIETTSACNLKCPFCVTTYANFKNGLMDLEVFRKIIDEGSAKGLCSVKLNWRGEPLIHPKVFEMVAYAKSKGIIDIFTNTNATLLTRELAKKIIECGMDRIIISFEGFEKKFYESQRVGAIFEETLGNIKNLMALKKELQSQFPLVRVQTILLDGLKTRIQEYMDFWSNIVDEVAYIDLKNEVKRVTVGKNVWACPQLWQRLTIAWDGRVLPCVNDTYCKMCLGRVPEDLIENIWRSEQLMKMRKIHDEGQAHTIGGCLDCPFRSAQILKSENREG